MARGKRSNRRKEPVERAATQDTSSNAEQCSPSSSSSSDPCTRRLPSHPDERFVPPPFRPYLVIQPVRPVRDNTHGWPLPQYKATGLPFFRFNQSEPSYEALYTFWLSAVYGNAGPWYKLSGRSFTHYTADVQLAVIADNKRLLANDIDRLRRTKACFDWPDLLQRWKEDYPGRAMACLAVWREELIRAEESAIGIYSRDEAPELNIGEFVNPPDAFERLVEQLTAEPDPALGFPLVRDERWERLVNPDLDPRPNGVPVPRGVRIWAEDSYVVRHCYLAQFVRRLIVKFERMQGGTPLKPADPMALSHRVTAADLENLPIDRKAIRLVDGSRENVSRTCQRCFKRDDHGKFAGCSKCFKAGVSIWYCGSECQLAHWKQHKPVCGKSLNSVRVDIPLPSAAPSAFT